MAWKGSAQIKSPKRDAQGSVGGLQAERHG